MAAETALFSTNIDTVFNRFVALGAATRFLRSLDGETWTSVTLTAYPLFTCMAYGRNILVTLGQTVNTANMVYTTGYAEALATWVNRTSPATGLANIGWQAIAFGNNTFVAVGGGIDTNIRNTATCTMTSTNSANWILYNGLTASDWRCIAFGQGKFVTLSYAANLARYSSDNGQTWSNGNGLGVGNWRSVIYDPINSKFVAVALQAVKVIAGTAACTSLQFTTGTNTITRVVGSFITDGYLTGQKIVVTGTTSNNGTFTITGTVNALTMTVVESLTNEGALSSLATVNSKPGDGATYSTDGITWATGTPSSPLEAARWISVATNGSGRCIAVANDTAGKLMAYSDDGGTNWTSVALPLIATWVSITYGSSGSNFHRWVAVNSTVANDAYSDDNGLTWSLGPMTSYAYTCVIWAPIPLHTNDTLTLQRGATVTVNTDQHPALSGMTITNGKLLIQNTSTSVPIRYVTARTSGALAQTIQPQDGLGTIDIQGNWIQIGTGDGTTNQTMTIPFTDYVSALWVETGVGTNTYEIWLNVAGAYGGTLKQYQDGLLDVSTGQRGKFFTQTPNSIQDKYITATATITFGLFSVIVDSIAGIYQGASITGQGIPANTLIEKVPIDTAAADRTFTFTSSVNTITASSGSFINDGYEYGDSLIVTGTSSNNGTYTITTITATVITVSQNLVNEGPLSATATIKVNKVMISQLPVTPGASYTANGYTNVAVKIFNPYSSQFTNQVVFGDGTNGNKLTSGVKVRVPNIMITSDTPANLQTASAIVGCLFDLSKGGNMLMDTCLFDESYHNWNQTQKLKITNVGLHIRPTLTETYALEVNGWGLGMLPTRRYNTGNIWLSRDIRDTQTNSILMNYVTNAILNNVVMVLQAPSAITAAAINAPTGMFNLSYSDSVTVTNMRMYSLNTTRAYQCGLALIATVTNSVFTNIEFYGGPMLSSQLSSSNTFTNLINSETMFAHSHNYTAGMRVTHDPTTQADMVSGTKYYFKARTFFSRDRTQYTESRVYSTTPFKGSTYYPDYITAFLNAPQSVTFAWTHRVPMYTSETSPLTNANAHNFLEIYRGTSPGFTKNLATKVAGFNNAPSISIPTIVTWATSTRTLTFSSSGKTITASSGNFITDGYATGQKLVVRGTVSSVNNGTFTIANVAATVITVSETLTTQSTYTQDVSIIANYIPTPKLFLTAAGGRTLAFTNATVTASARNLTFGGTVALATTAPKMTASGGRTISFVRASSTITCSSGSFVTDGFLTGDKIYVTGTTSNNTMAGNFFTLSGVAAGTLTLTVASDYLADEGPLSSTATIWAMRTTIACSSGSFVTDGFIVGDKIRVTGTTYNNTTGSNYLTVTTVAATMLTCTNDLVFPEGPFSSTATLAAYHVVGSTGNFVTDGYAIGDIITVTGSANAGNNKTFTVTNVLAAGTMMSFAEATATQAAESSGATLTTYTLPIPKVVFLDASPNREICFQNSVSQAAATTRIMTFDYINRTIRSTGTVPGNFITDGFIVGDKVSVTNTTYNNKVVLTITAVTATLMTMGATDRIFDETSTTATLTANRIKASSGSFVTDVWAIGDTATVAGTTSNNGNYIVNNVLASALTLTSNVVNETLSYRSGAVITATKLLPHQKIYGTANRTFTTGAAAKTLTLSSGSMLQDGYIVGDRVLVNGMGTDGNHIYTITTLTAVILTWLEAATPTASLVNTNAVSWVHTGNRPSILGNAATQTWNAASKTLTLGTGTWDTTYNFKVGDKFLVTGQKYNNGLFTISNISTNVATVTEPVIIDTAVYNAAANIITGYANPQKRTITASGGRTWLFDNISKKLTASSGSFILDGYYVGDCVQISGTPSGINDGYFTISGLSATVMNFNELVYPVTSAITATATLSAADISDNTDYYYVVRKYDDTGIYHDSEEIYVKSAWQVPATNLCLQGTAFAQNKIATLQATSARTLQFAASGNTITASSGSFSTDTYAIGDKIRITRTASNNGYFTVVTVGTTTMNTLENLVDEATSGTTGAITDIYWDNMKVPLFTASAVRTLQFTTASSQAASVTRIFGFSSSTITVTGSTPGSFITDGILTGDKIMITGTSANNGIFTVTGTVNATSLTVVESFVTESGNILGLIRCRKIILAGSTPGSFVTDGYAVNDKITVAGTTSNNATFTIATVEAAKLTVYEAITAEGPLSATATITNVYITVGAATRVSPFVTTTAAQTADALLLTSIIDNATLTQPISTATGNTYTFSVWVATQPTIVKIAAITASAVRSFKFDGLSLTAAGGRTLQWTASGKTITASSGSFHTDGYAIGDKLIVTGTTNNNSTFTITTLSPTVITVAETLVNEGPLSATATIKVNKITAYGTTPGNFIENGFQIGDRVQTAAGGSVYNIGWFTITNVVAHILNVAETVFTEAVIAATLTIADFYPDTFSATGSISLGTANQAFTATAQWQEIAVSFTATGSLHNAVIKIDTQKRGLCIIGAMVNLGATSQPYLTTTTATVSNANQVRDINLVRAWCRGYGEAASHSGVEIQLAAAVTGELWTEVYGYTYGASPSFITKVFDTWAGTGQTIIFNQESSNNLLNGLTQAGIGAPTNYGLVYFAAASSSNRIMNLTYNLHGTLQLYLASFNTQSNNESFYNWNISNWRNYASTVGNAPIFATSNATSGLTVENLVMNNSELPFMDAALGFLIKGMSGGNVKPLNSALLNNMPVAPVYTLANTPAAAVNFDSVTSALTATNYTTVYDTIFKELYHTATTGSLFIQFNASAKVNKPYVLSGNAKFSNSGRLSLISPGDSVEYTWPHRILGVSGFQNVPFLLDGVDLGNTLSILEGLKIEYKIDTTGSGYPANWTEATPAALSALTISPTAGFYFKLKITAMAGMKYSTVTHPFVVGESIRGLSSLATATVDRDFYYPVQGSCWITPTFGTFVAGETIVSNSSATMGEMRCVNVATNTTFALFPSASSYIDGLQIYTTVDQTAKYPAKVVTITLANIVPGSVYYIFNADNPVEIIAQGTASGSPGPGETTIDYSFSIVYSVDKNITIRVRKSSAPVKYLPYETGGTLTTAGAYVFVAQVFDSVVIDLYAGISSDFTIDATLKTIKHSLNSNVYTVDQLYSWLQDYFDELNYLDDQVPMSASTPTEYNLINGWFIDDPSFKFLTGGAITSIGQINSIRILTLNSAGYTNAGSGNIGQTVTGAITGDTGKLLAYDNVSHKWWIRMNSITDLFDNSSESITVSGSSAGGTMIVTSITGESVWSNIFTLGSLVPSTTLNVYQADIQITPWWTTGHIDILVKVQEAGVLIDSGNLTVLARTYGSLYDHFVIGAGSGRNPVPLAAFADGNNQTSSGTVAAYSGFTFTFGAVSKDMGYGPQPYDGVVECNNHSITQVYEYLKYVTRTGSATTLNGVSGEYYTGVGDVRFAYDSKSGGVFVEGELIAGTAGIYGHLVSLTDNGATGYMVLRNVHGTFADNMTLTGAAATALVNGTITTITPQKQAPFGTLAGGQFFGAQGIWLEHLAAADNNNIQLINSLGVTQTPPSYIYVTVSGLEVGDMVSVFRTTGNNNIIDKTYLRSHTSNNVAATTTWETDALTPIPADTPVTGIIRLVKTATNVEQRIAYSSWSGNIFTLSSAHSGGYGSGDTAYVPFIDTVATGASESTSFSYVQDRYIYSIVRHKGIIPFDVKGQITTIGYSLTAIRTIDSIVA